MVEANPAHVKRLQGVASAAGTVLSKPNEPRVALVNAPLCETDDREITFYTS